MYLRPLTPVDAPLVSALMQRIYPPAYTYLWEDAGAWYLQKMYNPERLERELADPAAEGYLVEHDGRVIGYYKIRRTDAPDDLPGSGLLLERLYLGAEAQGLGIGRRLVERTLEVARAEGRSVVWLQAMEVGPARGFYERLGFRACSRRELDFPGMHRELNGLLLLKRGVKG